MAKAAKPDQKPEETLANDAAAAQSAGGPKKISRLYIFLGLIALILFNTLLLFFLLPSPGDVAKKVKEANDTEVEKPVNEEFTAPPLPANKATKIKTAERPFGATFRVQDMNRTDPTKMDGFIGTFIAIIRESDAKEYDKIYAEKENTIRSIIQTILRESSMEDRTNPHLNVIRGKIIRQVNNEFGVPYVQDVVCPDAKTEIM